jgi:PAS domain S-box-containing protein
MKPLKINHKKFAAVLGVLVAATGLLVLAGWQYEIGFLKRPIPHLVAMNPVTALCFVLSGVSIVLLATKKADAELRLKSSLVIMLSALVLMLIGLLKLMDFILELGVEPDQFLFTKQIIEERYAGISNRIAPTTALNFCLSGISLLLIANPNKRVNSIASFLALIIFGIGIFSVLGCFYHVAEFRGFLAVLPMAVHTAICWLLVAVALMFINYDKGFMVAFTSQNPGGKIARILVPAAILIPVLFGYIRLRLNWEYPFSLELGVAFLMSSIMLVFFSITLYASVMLYKSDKAKSEVEKKLVALNNDLNTVNERIFKIFNLTPVAINISSMQDGRFKFVNDAFLKLFLLKREDVIGKTAAELNINSKESRERMIKYAAENNFKVDGAEVLLRDGNGKTHDMLASIEKIELDDGFYLLSTLLDITERKEAEKRVRESNERFFKIFNLSPVPTAITDIVKGYQFVNDAFVNLFGFSREELMGKNSVSLNMLSAEERVKIVKHIQEHGNNVRNVEIKLRDKTGEMLDVLMSTENIEMGSDTFILTTAVNITERKKAETELIKNRKTLNDAQRLSKTGSWEFNLETHELHWSEELYRIFELEGIPDNELLGSYRKKIHPEDLANLDKSIKLATEKGETIVYEHRIILNDGSIRYLLGLGEVLKNEEGKPLFQRGTAQDITERVEIEKALKEAHANLSAAQKLSKTGSWEFNLQTHELFWSEELYHIFELEETPADKLYDACRKKIHPDDLLNLDHAIKIANEKGEAHVYEHRIVLNDGRIKFLFGLGEIIKNEKGEPEWLRGTTQDITERVEIEKELKEAHANLSAAQKIAHMGSWEWNIKTNEERWSNEQYRVFGYEPDEVAATYSLFQNALHPDDKAAVGIAVEQALGGIKPFEMEYRIIRKDGAVRHIEAKGEVGFDKEGKPETMRGTVHDITERKEIEEKLKHYYLALDAKNKEIEQFAFIASHDLQEPLRTINSFNELLTKEYADKFDDNGRIYVKYISQSALRMRELITGLLDYSRLGNKRVLRKTDCNALLKDVVSNLHTAISESGAVIEAGTLPVIEAYELELSLLFQNLISNAIKFRKKDVTLQLNITAEHSNSEWKFAFTDNGIGIKEKHFEKIFVIFQRLHTRDVYEGTGIGLSHCKKIVELHGGKMWVESTAGVGSVFYFTIPEQRSEIS